MHRCVAGVVDADAVDLETEHRVCPRHGADDGDVSTNGRGGDLRERRDVHRYVVVPRVALFRLRRRGRAATDTLIAVGLHLVAAGGPVGN